MSAKFPRGVKNIFRRILRKDNELAHLLHQVTYVTASNIKILQQTFRFMSLFI